MYTTSMPLVVISVVLMEHLTELFQCYEYSMTLPVMLIKDVKRKGNFLDQRKNHGKLWLDGLLVSPAVRICSISDVIVCGYLYKPWKYTEEQAAVRASSGDASMSTFSIAVVPCCLVF
ncbi:hypothetical protein MKW92_034067 [Papaver armeniacum]|nr:hypothetical protein MKW92_034067 [Papaver armeniacum]